MGRFAAKLAVKTRSRMEANAYYYQRSDVYAVQSRNHRPGHPPATGGARHHPRGALRPCRPLPQPPGRHRARQHQRQRRYPLAHCRCPRPPPKRPHPPSRGGNRTPTIGQNELRAKPRPGATSNNLSVECFLHFLFLN